MRHNVSLLGLALLVALASGSHETHDEVTEAQTPIATGNGDGNGDGDSFECKHPPYTTQIVSSSPLLVYLKGFLTPEERAHLRSASRDAFRRSAIGGGSRSAQRTSSSAYIGRDPVVHCIEERAAAFQGHDVSRAQLEPLQLVRYAPSERYNLHTDWFSDKSDADAGWKLATNGGNRISSFFSYVYVSSDTTGGGTNFPLISAPKDERWCDVVDCDEPWERGVTFRPIEGNAIFWANLYADGSGDQRTLHAGLPVTSGDKIGINIWTRQAMLAEEVRGVDEYPEV
ncbi:hypothetical protein B0T17DRAFT_384309 [Bombardia bombarda]|uniref:Fe2OG dioxygenase domain-containing protein n=1 Tax=Bombardia bombarda TaxID=252184 RepID=A0AA39TMJ0_9PEZI|nr:hypothetical protein B0T17DRAFT_384309 [Bombardia bombarda]